MQCILVDLLDSLDSTLGTKPGASAESHDLLVTGSKGSMGKLPLTEDNDDTAPWKRDFAAEGTLSDTGQLRVTENAPSVKGVTWNLSQG